MAVRFRNKCRYETPKMHKSRGGQGGFQRNKKRERGKSKQSGGARMGRGTSEKKLGPWSGGKKKRDQSHRNLGKKRKKPISASNYGGKKKKYATFCICKHFRKQGKTKRGAGGNSKGEGRAHKVAGTAQS